MGYLFTLVWDEVACKGKLLVLPLVDISIFTPLGLRRWDCPSPVSAHLVYLEIHAIQYSQKQN